MTVELRSIAGRRPWADSEPARSGIFDPKEYTGSERVCVITRFFLGGGRMTVAEAAEMTGLSPSGARNLLRAVSRVLPLYDDAGTWRMVGDPGPEDVID